MRSRNELERLAAAGRPLLSQADSLVDGVQQDEILGRILSTSRLTAPVRPRPKAAVALAGIALVAAAGILAWIELDPGATHQHAALTGARIEMAGYHFRTPAGFKASSTSCTAPMAGANRFTKGFAAAASAEGACVGAFIWITSPSGSAPDPARWGAHPVVVGAYHGYYAPQHAFLESTLYIRLPHTEDNPQYLTLFGKGLTEQQLAAIAESGLPPNR